jgi:hypothetical protein
MFRRDWFGQSRVKARGRRAGRFWAWTGAVVFALGMWASPGFAQPEEEEEEPAQARPAPEEKVRLQDPGAAAKGALRPSAEGMLTPEVGQQTPSAEVTPALTPEAGEIQKEQQIPQR